jgi:hypothetical protein
MSVLGMPTARDLEDLIIDAMYLDILRGKLDQKEAQLEIEYTMGRDLEPGKLEAMLNALKDWCVDYGFWSRIVYADGNLLSGPLQLAQC